MGDSESDGRSIDDGQLPTEAYRTIFDNAAEGFFVHPPDSDEVLAVNKRLAEMLGYTREELLDLRVSDITADDWDPEVSAEERIRQAREEGQVTFEWRDQRRDGSRFWVEVSLTVVTLDGDEHVLASIRDIEQRKQQERRRRAIFDQTYQFTGLMEPDGTLVEANRTALEFGDLDREDVIGKRVWNCYWFEYDTEVQQEAKRAVERSSAGEFVRQNVEVRGSDGTEIIDFSIRPITDDSGAVTMLIPEGRVITERVEQQERLTVYNRVLRHNARNQLMKINGFAREVKQRTDDDRTAEYADAVLRSSQQLEKIAEQVRELDKLRQGPLPTEQMDLREFLERLVAEYDTGSRGTTIETSIPSGMAIESNPQLIRLAVDNLLENAVEHGGPTVRVSASQPEAPNREGIEITVRDDGPGIEPNEYEPVLTGRSDPVAHATSIGLFIVKWSLDELGGEVEFESPDDDGTVATIWLPPFAEV